MKRAADVTQIDGRMEVARAEANRRVGRFVVGDLGQRSPPRGNRVATGNEMSVLDVRGSNR